MIYGCGWKLMWYISCLPWFMIMEQWGTLCLTLYCSKSHLRSVTPAADEVLALHSWDLHYCLECISEGYHNPDKASQYIIVLCNSIKLGIRNMKLPEKCVVLCVLVCLLLYVTIYVNASMHAFLHVWLHICLQSLNSFIDHSLPQKLITL